MGKGFCLRLLFIPAVFIAGLFASGPAHSDGSIVLDLFPPESFVKTSSGFPVPVERTFAAPDGEGDFILHVRNGDTAGRHKASMAIIRVNGEKVVSLPDLCRKVEGFEKPISGIKKGANVITVKMIGEARSQLTISVSGRYARDAVSPARALAAGAAGTGDLPAARGVESAETVSLDAALSGAPKRPEPASERALAAAGSPLVAETVR